MEATHGFLTPADIDEISHEVAEYLRSEAELWVAEHAGTPAGFLGRDGEEIAALFVDPALHRSGVGRRLMNHAARLGADWLQVNEQNPGARAFYERLGFVAGERTEVDSAGRPFPLLTMRRDVMIRTAQLDDAPAIAALTREAYAKWVALIGREPLPMTVDYAQAVREHRFDLLHEGPELAALIETIAEPEVLLVVNVAVAPRFQGRGYGVRLMALAEDLARAQGLARTRLYTNQLFAENIALYASLGYRVDREEPLNGGVAVHMSKALA